MSARERFFGVKLRMVLSAYLLRTGLPAFLCKPSEFMLLSVIMSSDALHISGGGFLTGMTRSRLWENCLLMHLCHLLGTPVVITGQTIGVFKGRTDRKLAKWGLKNAKFIYLRDRGESEAEIKKLGIHGENVQSTFDDALFCEKADNSILDDMLRNHDIDISLPIITANFHYWGQIDDLKAKAVVRFAQLCDHLVELTSAQILFIPMTPPDEIAERAVIDSMVKKATLLKYDYDYRIARGVIARSKLMFTMKHHPIIFAYGEGIPVVSVALDDYYCRKNMGAMQICGQGEFCIDERIFFSDDQAKRILERAWFQRDESMNLLKTWISEAEKKEFEAIELFWHQLHKC